nr:N-acetylmuramoyl-L-alanine amidase [Propionibacterium sp.]
MTQAPRSTLRRVSRLAAPAAVALVLVGCAGGGTAPTLAPRLQAQTTSGQTPAFTPAANPTIVAPGAYDKPSTGGVTLAPTASGKLDGKVIALDPGHNTVPIRSINQKSVKYYGAGWRPCQNEGSTGLDKKTPEATIVWQITQYAVPILREQGATVVLSRPDDNGTGPCNDERAEIANRANADLLISIHGDGNENQKNRGFHVIYSKTMAGGEAVAAASKKAATIMVGDLRANTRIPTSNYVGSALDGTYENSDTLGVLNTMRTGPAILVEIGNIIQTDDWAIMSSPEGQEEIARALAIGAADIVLSAVDAPETPSGSASGSPSGSASKSPSPSASKS